MRMRVSPLVLAVYPMARGYAFALFEGPYNPVDWGISRTYGPLKNRRCLAAVRDLIRRYKPDHLVVQAGDGKVTRRARRIRDLNEALARLGEEVGVATATHPRSAIIKRFAFLGFVTKQAIAETIAKHLPAFERFVPPVRKPWMSEDPRMGLFDAVALILVFFQEVAKEQPP